MSVQCNTYAMIGAILPYEAFKNDNVYERLEPFMDSAFKGIHHSEGLCVLFDGMNGEYVAIGRVVAKSANHEGFVAPVRLTAHDADISEVKGSIRRTFGDLIDINNFKVEPIVISHYR